MKENKKRLDALIVERNLAESREKAQRLILAGLAQIKGVDHPKPGMRIPPDTEIFIDVPGERYVSRGGYKLGAALDAFHIDPFGMVCLDVGASTGGFTDCLLQRGAKRIYAVDVGYGQFHYRLRNDPRIILLERVNARYLTSSEIPESIDLAVIDVSFISLHLVLQPIIDFLSPRGTVVALIKPQFEAGKEKVPRGGVIRDREIHCEVLELAMSKLRDNGWRVTGLTPSPIAGVSGNREYLACLIRGKSGDASEAPLPDISAVVLQAFKE
ncbi:TlyA family RNA methyltransferase [Candidatus Sumerlaeota bacterium]|nr:TlyA family RNA methyltransferase [Candidatus Sumerlaeota bacterium]